MTKTKKVVENVTIETTEQTKALLVRCFGVNDSNYDGETIVACEAGQARVISEDERTQLLRFLKYASSRHMLVEPFGEADMRRVIVKAQAKAVADRIAAEKHRAAEAERIRLADIKRKQKRLAALEQKAAEALAQEK